MKRWAPSSTPSSRALLALALSYHTWRTLTREAGLKQRDAVEVMVKAILAK